MCCLPAPCCSLAGPACNLCTPGDTTAGCGGTNCTIFGTTCTECNSNVCTRYECTTLDAQCVACDGPILDKCTICRPGYLPDPNGPGVSAPWSPCCLLPALSKGAQWCALGWCGGSSSSKAPDRVAHSAPRPRSAVLPMHQQH